MKTTLGQAIVVENIPTAAGTVGVGHLAQAAPDGYTIGTARILQEQQPQVSAMAADRTY
jgi:tripartite-type tricarboxylate transporter receptor subunit TctC